MLGIAAAIFSSSIILMLPSALSNQQQPQPPLQSAFATFPGENGKIAYEAYEDGYKNIFVMNQDGSGQTNISTDPAFNDFNPDWSPDGTKIAFTSTRDGNLEIYVMSSIGTNLKRLTNNAASDSNPEWSPDGSKIAFESSRYGNDDIYVMAFDGSGQTRLTVYPSFDVGPTWSPDGTKIAFRRGNDIYVMDPFGFDQTKLSDAPTGFEGGLDWSPDGTKIAFHVLSSPASVTREIYVMNADGSGVTNISNDPDSDYSGPSWSPDGTKIAFQRAPSDDAGTIHLMNADGSGKTGALASGFSPDFGPKNPVQTIIDLQLLIKLLTAIQNLGEDVAQSVKTSLTAPLREVANILSDNNPDNDRSICGKFSAFINQVNAAERRGSLTVVQADDLRTQAEDIRNMLDC